MKYIKKFNESGLAGRMAEMDRLKKLTLEIIESSNFFTSDFGFDDEGRCDHFDVHGSSKKYSSTHNLENFESELQSIQSKLTKSVGPCTVTGSSASGIEIIWKD